MEHFKQFYKCPSCNQAIEKREYFICPECGAALCEKSALVIFDGNYCGNCGAELGSAKKEALPQVKKEILARAKEDC